MKNHKTAYVYVCEHDTDGTPFYAVVFNPSDLPDEPGLKVKEYTLRATKTLTIKRELK